MSNPRFTKIIYQGFLFLIIISLGYPNINFALKYPHSLSPLADGYGEANTVRAAEYYARHGFLDNFGLPDFCYGDQFPNEGAGARCWKLSPKRLIYTHYPDLPYLMTGILTKMCGVGNLGCFRLFPIYVAILCLFIFAQILRTAIGAGKSVILLTALALTPMTSNMMHGLGYQGYALSLLLIQLGILIIICKTNSMKKSQLCILAFLGFLQGCMSFDYFFLVSLSAIPIALLYLPLKQKEERKGFYFLILCPAGGFVFAHFLHFIQVCLFDQSYTAAFQDLFQTANQRFNEPSTGKHLILKRLETFFEYLFTYVSDNRYLGMKSPLDYILIHFHNKRYYLNLNFPLFIVAVCFFLWIKEATLIVNKPIRLTLKWSSSRKKFYALGAAFIVSFLWVIIMQQHAAEHPHFIPRIIFLFYFMSILIILECFQMDRLKDKIDGPF